jgi:hypothetical protein
MPSSVFRIQLLGREAGVIWRNCFVIVGVYIFKFFFCSRQLQPEMIDLEVRGTLNVVEACSNAAVNRLLLTSSLSAMVWDQHRNSETVPVASAAGACIDEKCWSNLDFCRSKKVLEYKYHLHLPDHAPQYALLLKTCSKL